MGFLSAQFVALPQKPTMDWYFYISFVIQLLVFIDCNFMFISFSLHLIYQNQCLHSVKSQVLFCSFSVALRSRIHVKLLLLDF